MKIAIVDSKPDRPEAIRALLQSKADVDLFGSVDAQCLASENSFYDCVLLHSGERDDILGRLRGVYRDQWVVCYTGGVPVPPPTIREHFQSHPKHCWYQRTIGYRMVTDLPPSVGEDFNRFLSWLADGAKLELVQPSDVLNHVDWVLEGKLDLLYCCLNAPNSETMAEIEIPMVLREQGAREIRALLRTGSLTQLRDYLFPEYDFGPRPRDVAHD